MKAALLMIALGLFIGMVAAALPTPTPTPTATDVPDARNVCNDRMVKSLQEARGATTTEELNLAVGKSEVYRKLATMGENCE